MSEFEFHPMFPHGTDTTPYRKLTDAGVSVQEVAGRKLLVVDRAAIVSLTAAAFHEMSHLLRPGHLAQLKAILDDPDASPNDKFVALDLLKNANIAAGGARAPTAATTTPSSAAARSGR